jgi:hypothetical protein
VSAYLDVAGTQVVIGQVTAVQGANVVGSLSGSQAGAPVVIGDLVAMPTPRGRSYGLVHALRRGRRAGDEPAVEIQLLGELVGGDDGGAAAPRFRRGVSACPALDTPILRAQAAEAALVYAAPPEAAHILAGSLKQAPDLPAHLLTDALLGRHFAVLGSTGSGKSCAVTVLLQAILRAHPCAHILLIDPHNEYGPAFGDRALKLDPSNLELPYWLLTFEEIAAILTSGSHERAYAEGAILREAILRAKQLHAGDAAGAAAHLTVDTPVPYRLSDLVRAIEDAMGTLNKPEAAAAYRHLLARIAAVRDDRRYGFMFQSLLLRDNLAPILGRLLRIPVAGRPVTLLDISGVPSEVVNVVVSVLCRLIFEFALWSGEAERSPPLLLVCEEAHRYVPGDGAAAFEPTRRAIDRIAKEGRKYGVALGLVTQRPAELSASSLSQCGTVLALRMSNERDLQFVRNVLPDGFEWLIRELPGLATGEAVVVGQAVRVPMQIRLSELPEHEQPSSRSPSFSAAWANESEDTQLLASTVHRWRHQQR